MNTYYEPKKSKKVYLESLVGKVYKILPLYQECNDGLMKYIENLHNEMVGATHDFKDLGESNSYIKVVNDLAYYSQNEFKNQATCRTVILGDTNLIKRLGSTNEVSNL